MVHPAGNIVSAVVLPIPHSGMLAFPPGFPRQRSDETSTDVIHRESALPSDATLNSTRAELWKGLGVVERNVLP